MNYKMTIVSALFGSFALTVLGGTVMAVDAPSAATSYSFVVGKSLSSALDAFARAANLTSLQRSKKDELRVWTMDYMLGRIDGYVISSSGSIKCESTSNYTGGVVTVDRARCRTWHKGSDALRALDHFARLDGKEWDCPAMDGGEVFLEGMHNGSRIALRVGNPWACSDWRSKAVTELLNKLG